MAPSSHSQFPLKGQVQASTHINANYSATTREFQIVQRVATYGPYTQGKYLHTFEASPKRTSQMYCSKFG